MQGDADFWRLLRVSLSGTVAMLARRGLCLVQADAMGGGSRRLFETSGVFFGGGTL